MHDLKTDIPEVFGTETQTLSISRAKHRKKEHPVDNQSSCEANYKLR
jgi:hypothetical protein